MTPLWTSKQACAATGGKCTGKCTGQWAATGVSIDTRSLAPGDLFVALSDTRDGHDYVARALKLGAAAALVSRVPTGVATDAPLLIVNDVLDALGALARAARTRSKAKIVAVTGSVGKTSTKDMLNLVLSRQGRTHAAEASFNNHWGVPLTLARMGQDTEFAVIEIGMNHPGEIAPLAELAAPEVAIVTSVTAAHLDAFTGLDAIAAEKATIFQGLAKGGTAVINLDMPQSAILQDAVTSAGSRLIGYGHDDRAVFRLIKAQIADNATIVQAATPDGALLYKLTPPGLHFALNSLATLAAVHALGGDVAMAAMDLARWSPTAGRGAKEIITLDIVDDHLSITLLDDAFNANPASMAAALDVLVHTNSTDGQDHGPPGRRIAILGDMLELGPDELIFHRDIKSLEAMAHIDIVHCAGSRMRALHHILPERQKGVWCADASALAAQAHGIVGAGDVVLVKGSKGSQISQVVDAIRNLGHPQVQTKQGNL